MRAALLAAVLLAAPALVWAQGGAATGARVESIVVTAPSIRVRTAPSMMSLSIDEFGQGTVFAVAADEYHSRDWVGITLDGRVAFIPRYAVAPRLRPVAPAQPSPARELAVVAQAGAPTPVALAPAPARPAAAAAPVAVAALPARVEPAPVPAVAPLTAAAPTPAPPTPAAPLPVAPMAAPSRPAPTVAAVAAEPARTPEHAPAPARAPERPALSGRRGGIDLTVGMLGSVTPIKTAGLTPTVHVAGVSFLGARYRGLGAYLAPEYGSGGGYRSTMLGGGVSLDLISLHLLRVTALGGYTTYSQTPAAADTASAPASATRALRGASVGGMASVPLFGPVRLAYRGQYVMLQDAGVAVPITRYSLGLLF